jgi:hypothetical protein
MSACRAVSLQVAQQTVSLAIFCPLSADQLKLLQLRLLLRDLRMVLPGTGVFADG